jgi:hypothetical protein
VFTGLLEPEQQDFFGNGSGAGFAFLLQHPPSWTGDNDGFGLQQLEMTSFCAGSRRGVELALEGSDAALLTLVSEGVYVMEEVSVSMSRPALIAFSSENGFTAADFRLPFWIRLFPATVAVGGARSDGQAHSVVNNDTLATTRAGRMWTAAQRSSRFSNLYQHPISMIAFGRAVTSNAWAAILVSMRIKRECVKII